MGPNSDSFFNDREIGHRLFVDLGDINLENRTYGSSTDYVPHHTGMQRMTPEAVARLQAVLDSQVDVEALIRRATPPPSEITDSNPWGSGPQA